MIKAIQYDLLIIDYIMPAPNGISFINELRKLPNYQHTPIYILSASIDDDAKTQAKGLNVTGWISKPFQPQTLISIVQDALK